VLLDAVGSSLWFKSAWPARFAAAGIDVVRAMPIELAQFHYARVDLRLHRKLFIVDGHTAWTGSMNLVDPGVFKQDAAVGEWVDAMLKVEGPVVVELQLTFLFDWAVNSQQTESPLPFLEALPAPAGEALAQTLASGPVYRDDVLYQVLIAAILDARRELIITTPYFGPDEGLVEALIAASRRGVSVTLIVPERNDSWLVALSSRSYYDILLNAGVRIAEFRGGLLHTKSLLIDAGAAIFGSVNFDLRSLRLNFEISLIVYDRAFGAALGALLKSYLAQSVCIDAGAWSDRPRWKKLLENAAYLMSPLL
jgi:cardiolipin synthase